MKNWTREGGPVVCYRLAGMWDAEVVASPEGVTIRGTRWPAINTPEDFERVQEILRLAFVEARSLESSSTMTLDDDRFYLATLESDITLLEGSS